MPEGVIVDGWNYVIAAYGVLFVVLAAFFTSLVHRSRGLNRTSNSERTE